MFLEPAGTMQSRMPQVLFHHIDADAEPLGNLRLWQIFETPHDETLAAPRWKLLDRLCKNRKTLFRDDAMLGGWGLVRGFVRKGLDTNQAIARRLSAAIVDRKIADDPKKIGAGIGNRLGLGRGQPQTGLLNDVFCRDSASGSAPGQRAQITVTGFEKLRQRRKKRIRHIT